MAEDLQKELSALLDKYMVAARAAIQQIEYFERRVNVLEELALDLYRELDCDATEYTHRMIGLGLIEDTEDADE